MKSHRIGIFGARAQVPSRLTGGHSEDADRAVRLADRHSLAIGTEAHTGAVKRRSDVQYLCSTLHIPDMDLASADLVYHELRLCREESTVWAKAERPGRTTGSREVWTEPSIIGNTPDGDIALTVGACI